MRIHILSDLHQELWEPGTFRYPEVKADVVVLAGDIHRGVQAVDWIAKHLPQDRPVLYVPGNHEFYGETFPEVLEEMRRVAETVPNLYLLEKDTITLNGVLFVGTTLWTDFNLLGNPYGAMVTAIQSMNDFRQIRVGPESKRLHPRTVIQWHQQAMAFLLGTLLTHRQTPVVVITHHAPTLRSIHPTLRQDPLSAAFASNLEPLMCRHSNLVLWIHGHTHEFTDDQICGTRVVSNPLGYPHESDTGFTADFTVDL